MTFFYTPKLHIQEVPDITFNFGKIFDSSRLFTNILKDIGAQLPAYGKPIEFNQEQSSQKGQIYIFENLQRSILPICYQC